MKTEKLAYLKAIGLQPWQLKQPRDTILMLIRTLTNTEANQAKEERLLNAMLEAINISNNSVCSFTLDPSNFDHTVLTTQINLAKPKILIALGEQTTQILLNPQVLMNQLREKIYTYNETPLIVTQDPAYLLQHPREKNKTLQDLYFIQQQLKLHL